MQRSIAAGLGMMEFPFDTTAGFWRWVDLCETGRCRIRSGRPTGWSAARRCWNAWRRWRHRRAHTADQVRRQRGVAGDARSGAARQAMRHDRLAVRGRLLPGFGIGSPRGPEWTAMHLDTTTRGRETDEALEIIHRLWTEEKVDFAGNYFRLTGVSIAPQPVQPDLPMWIGGSPTRRSGGRRATAPAGRPGRRRRRRWRRDRRDPRRRDRSRPAASTTITTARRSRSASAAGRSRHEAGDGEYRNRTGRDPRAAISRWATRRRSCARIAAYVEAGVIEVHSASGGAGDQDMLAQTRRLVEQVLPQMAVRWPKPRKAAA